MSVAARAVPRKRSRRGPSPEAALGRRLVDARPIEPAERVATSFLERLVRAFTPDTDAEKTLLLGLALLGLGLVFSPLPWLALVAPGGVLTFVAVKPTQ